MVLADLERAQRLIRKVHPDPIDPQFRIASAEGDWWNGITLTENAKERARRLGLVSDFMAWKLSPGFILATELHEPDALVSVGVRHNDYAALLSVILREPSTSGAATAGRTNAWAARIPVSRREPLSFETAKILKSENMDPAMLGLLPRGTR